MARKVSKKITKKVTKKVTKKATKKITKKIAKKISKKVISAGAGKNPSLALGQVVPEIVLKNSKGVDFSLGSQRGHKVVLYFYPKDDTPGCTIEGQQFNQLLPRFEQAQTRVFGISRDSVASHDKFACKYGFQFELLSDVDERACRLFQVIKEKNMYGKKVLGIERSTFVLDEKGQLIGEYRGVKADGHAAEILEKVSKK
jgi:peroxiredoxin Q/BCP